MLHVNVLLTLNDAAEGERIQLLLAQQAQLSRAEPGCLRFEVYRSQGDARLFMLVERWQSQADLDAHRRGQAFREIYEPQVLPFVTRDPHVWDLVA